jgi:hypothetical protein
MSKDNRYMCETDWNEEKVVRVPHLNSICVPTGFNRNDGIIGNPLLPACIFEDKLTKIFDVASKTFPDLLLKRAHVKMPYWTRGMEVLPDHYSITRKAKSLSTTSITVALTPKPTCDSKLEYAYNSDELLSLRDRLNSKYDGNKKPPELIGNLGYYMTENLIEGILPWTHNTRYSEEYHLKTVKSYLGFYYYTDNDKNYSTFMGAHPACVAIKKNGETDIISKLTIDKYDVKIGNSSFVIDSVNSRDLSGKKVAIFTPGYQHESNEEYLYNLSEFTPMIPSHNSSDRINIFVANEGNGKMPVEKIIKIWNGTAPIPSFGAVISFDKKYYYEIFDNSNLLNDEIEIKPLINDFDINDYSQILGGFVPAVSEHRHLYDVSTVEEMQQNMQKYGNAMSAIAQAGRETRNFDPYIREPAGLLIETDNRIGWVLFDGRHELSIGVSVSDVVKILKMLEKENVFEGKVKNALFIDGGSAMKAYIASNKDNEKLKLDLLNRAAAGARNGPGDDSDGLNFYSTLSICLRNHKA